MPSATAVIALLQLYFGLCSEAYRCSYTLSCPYEVSQSGSLLVQAMRYHVEPCCIRHSQNETEKAAAASVQFALIENHCRNHGLRLYFGACSFNVVCLIQKMTWPYLCHKIL